MGCCLGGDDGEEAKNTKAANESTPLNKKTKGQGKDEEQKEASPEKKASVIQFESGKSKKKLPFYVQTPMIQKNDNEIILLYTEKNKTKYNILNTTDAKLGETVEIKCDDDFNVYNTVYALNKNDNKIYFIENNTNILSLDLNENELVSLNKTITTTNDNYASIIYNDATSKLVILGAEEKSDEDENYELVPYAPFTVNKGDGPVPKLKGFGRFSRVLNVNRDGADYIYVLGGASKQGDYMLPNDTLLMYRLGKCEPEERYAARFTAQPLFRFGAINYDNRYIVTFGGTVMKKKEVKDETNGIYVLPLTKDNKADISPEDWFELSKKLKVKGKSQGKLWFNALCINGIIHFTSYGGKYYTMKMKSILDEIDIGANKDQEEGLINLHPWTQAGKTVTPTKSTTVEPMGPKEDDDDK